MIQELRPERYLVVLADFRVIAGIDDIWRISLLTWHLGIHDTELEFLVNDETAVAVARIHLVVFPHRVDEEGLHGLLFFYLDGIDGVHEVGVVEQDLRGLLGEILSDGVDEVQQTGVQKNLMLKLIF